MRHVWVVVSCLVIFTSLTAISVVAQDKPLAEVTGAYQFNHLTASSNGQSASTNVSAGFDANVNIPVTRWFGALGDVGRVWKHESTSVATAQVSGTASIWTYGGGPQLTSRTQYVQPFARFILGDAHSGGSVSVTGIPGVSGVSGGASADSFFIAPGGGADFRITRNVWLHGGADYLRTSKYGVTVNGVRAFGGITFVIGRKGQAPPQDRPATARTPYTTASPPQPSAPQQQSTPHTTGAGMKLDALGVKVTLGRSAGAEIIDEAPNGVAALAGLHQGDVINAVDSKPVRTPMELAAALANRQAGDKARLGYLIHGTWQTETVVLLAH